MNEVSHPAAKAQDARKRLDIQCLAQAINDLVSVQADIQKSRDSYDGYSWDYFHSDLLERRDRATAELQVRLDEYIDSRIAAATGARP